MKLNSLPIISWLLFWVGVSSISGWADEGDIETATNALDIGASDLMPTDAHPEELALRIDIQLERKRAADRQPFINRCPQPGC